jgi:hypothetical protein
VTVKGLQKDSRVQAGTKANVKSRSFISKDEKREAPVAALPLMATLRHDIAWMPQKKPSVCKCLAGAAEHAPVVWPEILQLSDYCHQGQHWLSCGWATMDLPRTASSPQQDGLLLAAARSPSSRLLQATN